MDVEWVKGMKEKWKINKEEIDGMNEGRMDKK